MPSVAEGSARPRRAPAATGPDQRVWVLRRHVRVSLREAHAIVTVDWDAGVARTACGLALRPESIADVPEGGCMPCVTCVAATPMPSSEPDGAELDDRP